MKIYLLFYNILQQDKLVILNLEYQPYGVYYIRIVFGSNCNIQLDASTKCEHNKAVVLFVLRVFLQNFRLSTFFWTDRFRLLGHYQCLFSRWSKCTYEYGRDYLCILLHASIKWINFPDRSSPRPVRQRQRQLLEIRVYCQIINLKVQKVTVLD